MRARWLVFLGIAGLAAPWLGATSAIAGSGGAAGVAVARASGPAPHAAVSVGTAGLSANPTVIYPPNALCTEDGVTFANSTIVTGTGFPASAAYQVVYNKKKATTVTGTTSSSGGFTATVSDVSQPWGSYYVKATAGTVSRTTWVGNGGDTCVSASGPASGLTWHWQGVGFDAMTTASILISGAVYESTTTSSLGAFKLRFVKACPGTGTLPLSFRGYFGGKQYTLRSGTISC